MADDDKKPDERPRPQFGELAPEGWVWRPPADHDRLDTSKPLAPADPEPGPESERTQYGAARGNTAPPHPEHTASTHPYTAHGDPAAPPAQLRREAPRWNLGWTTGLLILGFFGMTNSISTLNALPAAIQLLHVNQSLSDYTPAPSVAGILTAGSITIGAIWVVSAVISVLLLTRGRLSFYVPLIAGAVAFVALIVFISLVLTTDPAFFTLYGDLTPASATPTP